MSDQTASSRASLWQRFRLRRRRQKYLWRAYRARRRLNCLQDHTHKIARSDILAVVVVRNEATRLPHFLQHYGALGVEHFLIVDNGSDDQTREVLSDRQNVSIWETSASYRGARFGLDWANHLLARYGHGHWCLVVDADELLVLPAAFENSLRSAAKALENAGRPLLGGLMLDLCHEGPLGSQPYEPGGNPLGVLSHINKGPYRVRRQVPLKNLWVQGGLREQNFFADNPRKSPTLNKLPFVKWHRRWAFVNSTHSILPPYLNEYYDGPGGETPACTLLHTKFLPEIVSKSDTEKLRKQHFHAPEQFDHYYDKISSKPVLVNENCERYDGVEQLEKLGFVSVGRGKSEISVRDKGK